MAFFEFRASADSWDCGLPFFPPSQSILEICELLRFMPSPAEVKEEPKSPALYAHVPPASFGRQVVPETDRRHPFGPSRNFVTASVCSWIDGIRLAPASFFPYDIFGTDANSL